MKNILIIVLILIMVSVLFGCSSVSESEATLDTDITESDNSNATEISSVVDQAENTVESNADEKSGSNSTVIESGSEAVETQRSVTIGSDGSDVIIDGLNTNNEWDNSACFIVNYDMDKTYEGVDGFKVYKLGSPSAADNFTNEDFSSKIYLKVDSEYIYFFEEKTCKNMYYKNDDATTSYLNNGGILFFVKNNGDSFESISDIMFQPRGFINTEATVARRTYPGQIGDNNVEYTAKSIISSNGYTIEAKVKLKSVNVSIEELESGNYYLTYCTSNSFDASIINDGPTKENFCQFNYFGVLEWGKSSKIIIKDN